MKIIVAGNISHNIRKSLTSRGFELFFTPENPRVLKGLGFHPDMQIAKGGDIFVCEPSLYDVYRDIFASTGQILFPGSAHLGCNYPDDIAYNIKAVGNTVFHNFRHTDSVLLHAVADRIKADVSQGYCGCSICMASSNAIITADKGIHKKAVSLGIESLLIAPGNIELEGFDYGFIGGASFFCGGTLYFFGEVFKHPDFDKIEEFCSSLGTGVESLGGETLTDYGGAITF